MDSRSWNLTMLAAIAALWLASGVQREKPILGAPPRDAAWSVLEADVATHPSDAARRRALAQSYLDARAPGLALRAIESAPAEVRAQPELEHVYARALFEQGRSADALAVERRVVRACSDLKVGRARTSGACDPWLAASAARRVAIFHELVALGVEDAQAHPEASAIAYHNATREARLALQ